jgi:hypothetical protein
MRLDHGPLWRLLADHARRTRHHDEDKDPAKIRRVMEALLKMVKLDANALEKAYRGSSAA